MFCTPQTKKEVPGNYVPVTQCLFTRLVFHQAAVWVWHGMARAPKKRRVPPCGMTPTTGILKSTDDSVGSAEEEDRRARFPEGPPCGVRRPEEEEEEEKDTEVRIFEHRAWAWTIGVVCLFPVTSIKLAMPGISSSLLRFAGWWCQIPRFVSPPKSTEECPCAD